jgi:hypothetical protein
MKYILCIKNILNCNYFATFMFFTLNELFLFFYYTLFEHFLGQILDGVKGYLSPRDLLRLSEEPLEGVSITFEALSFCGFFGLKAVFLHNEKPIKRSPVEDRIHFYA